MGQPALGRFRGGDIFSPSVYRQFQFSYGVLRHRSETLYSQYVMWEIAVKALVVHENHGAHARKVSITCCLAFGPPPSGKRIGSAMPD